MDLSEKNFIIGEPHDALEVTAQPTLPLTLRIIVDLSLGGDAELIRNTLRAYFDSYYQPGDDVTLYLLNGADNTPTTVQITSLEQARDEIGKLNTTRNFYTLRTAFDRVIEDLQAKGVDIAHPAHVVLVGSLLSNPREARSSQMFKDRGYPLHVIQAHRSRQPFTTAFRTLANTGGGLYSNNLGGTFVISGDALTPFAPVNTLKVLFDTINNSRIFYQVRYRSLNRELSPQRNVDLTILLSDGQQLTQTFTYQWTFQPPVIEFVNTGELSPVRRPFRDTPVGDINFDIAQQNVNLQLRFPDGVQRKINSLQWQILDRTTNQVIQSDIIQSPQFDNSGRLTIPWPIDGNAYSNPGASLNIVMQVSVTDELNLKSEAVGEGRVTIAAAPTIPPPTLPPPTAVPTVVVTVERVVPRSTAFGGNGLDIPPVLLGALMGLILVLLCIVFYMVLRYRRLRVEQEIKVQEIQKQLQASLQANSQNQAAAQPVETSTSDGDQPLLARLYVTLVDNPDPIEGLQKRVIEVNAEEFIIGRSAAEGCNHIINADFISPRHCKISMIHRRYYVRDLNSKNGTFVNGEPIPPNQDVPVPIGSEIGITRKITVELWDPETEIEVQEEVVRLSTVGTHTRYQDQLSFKPLPGLVYAGDPEGTVDDDYSPI